MSNNKKILIENNNTKHKSNTCSWAWRETLDATAVESYAEWDRSSRAFLIKVQMSGRSNWHGTLWPFVLSCQEEDMREKGKLEWAKIRLQLKMCLPRNCREFNWSLVDSGIPRKGRKTKDQVLRLVNLGKTTTRKWRRCHSHWFELV